MSSEPEPLAPARQEPITGRGATTVESMRAPGRYQTYRPHHGWAWWNRNRRYQVYLVRELSALFCAIWAFNQIRQLNSLSQGERAYQEYVSEQRRPGWVVLNTLGYAFMLLHSITWFKLLGGLDLVKLGDRKAPPDKVTVGAFGGWGLASLVAALVMLFGGRRRT